MRPAVPDQRRYWRANLCWSAGLLVVWSVATFGVAWFAADLSTVEWLGWPLGFYMAAQGSVIIYVLVVWVYAHVMERLDARHRTAGHDEQGGAP